ncbi:Acetyltransferase (GNAT) family protein [Parelusimicrobium proximum]|uniref:GNAT family N-acetyltransferase n=1 Tax=Parelusimicrobium proximum TaxID=3228953 RepID=UPI003D17EF2B
MNIEIKKLTADLLEDWLYLFDNDGCSADNEWAGCYCMAPHWSNELQSEKEWEYSKAGAARNRKYAQDYIRKGLLQGYLAYYDGKVAGWCNANDKQAYDSIFFKLPWEESEKDKKIKSIACFFVSPSLRGKGIATRLIAKLCSDAADGGYEYVEAYPFTHDNNKAYTGPVSMYEKMGFTVCDNTNDYVIVFRKYL